MLSELAETLSRCWLHVSPSTSSVTPQYSSYFFQSENLKILSNLQNPRIPENLNFFQSRSKRHHPPALRVHPSNERLGDDVLGEQPAPLHTLLHKVPQKVSAVPTWSLLLISLLDPSISRLRDVLYCSSDVEKDSKKAYTSINNTSITAAPRASFNWNTTFFAWPFRISWTALSNSDLVPTIIVCCLWIFVCQRIKYFAWTSIFQYCELKTVWFFQKSLRIRKHVWFEMFDKEAPTHSLWETPLWYFWYDNKMFLFFFQTKFFVLFWWPWVF